MWLFLQKNFFTPAGNGTILTSSDENWEVLWPIRYSGPPFHGTRGAICTTDSRFSSWNSDNTTFQRPSFEHYHKMLLTIFPLIFWQKLLCCCSIIMAAIKGPQSQALLILSERPFYYIHLFLGPRHEWFSNGKAALVGNGVIDVVVFCGCLI